MASTKQPDDSTYMRIRKGEMAKKLDNAKPYNIFMPNVFPIRQTHSEPLAITLLELYDISLGEIECSLQISYMVDVEWFLDQLQILGNVNEKKNILILHGDNDPERLTALKKFPNDKYPNVHALKIPVEHNFGIHHSKIMMFCYTDNSIRVVVSTANLYDIDWEISSQGLWLGPKCHQLPAGSKPDDGESATGFKSRFVDLLKSYGLDRLKPYIDLAENSDFGEIKYVRYKQFVNCTVQNF